MDYTIDVMKPEEKDEVLALMKRCFPKAYHSIFFAYPETTLVAHIDGKVVGGINLDVFDIPGKKKIGYLGWLYTDTECRGLGIGAALAKDSIKFMEEAGCQDIVACVEGDNGSSMKTLAGCGFSIMPLRRQMTHFGIGLLKINKRASRFFDMGYFLWHLELPPSDHPMDDDQRSFLSMAFLNMLAWIPCLTGWNLMHLLFPSFMPDCRQDWMFLKYPILLLTFPVFVLALRALSTELSAKIQNVEVQYLGWDTAWLMGFLCPLILGIPFPVPGNVYLSGYHWRNADMDGVLCKMARTEQLALAFFCLLFRHSIALRYCFTLLVLDCLFFFYPFSGFNANRVFKRGMAAAVTPIVMTIATAVILFL